jgi:hypothetical protein
VWVTELCDLNAWIHDSFEIGKGLRKLDPENHYSKIA